MELRSPEGFNAVVVWASDEFSVLLQKKGLTSQICRVLGVVLPSCSLQYCLRLKLV